MGHHMSAFGDKSPSLARHERPPAGRQYIVVVPEDGLRVLGLDRTCEVLVVIEPRPLAARRHGDAFARLSHADGGDVPVVTGHSDGVMVPQQRLDGSLRALRVAQPELHRTQHVAQALGGAVHHVVDGRVDQAQGLDAPAIHYGGVRFRAALR